MTLFWFFPSFLARNYSGFDILAINLIVCFKNFRFLDLSCLTLIYTVDFLDSIVLIIVYSVILDSLFHFRNFLPLIFLITCFILTIELYRWTDRSKYRIFVSIIVRYQVFIKRIFPLIISCNLRVIFEWSPFPYWRFFSCIGCHFLLVISFIAINITNFVYPFRFFLIFDGILSLRFKLFFLDLRFFPLFPAIILPILYIYKLNILSLLYIFN